MGKLIDYGINWRIEKLQNGKFLAHYHGAQDVTRDSFDEAFERVAELCNAHDHAVK